jgi:RIO kinase 1
VQSSRSARALSRRSRFGQKEAENSWITAEVNALNTLSAAGLRVPRPYGFFDGVLIMELIVDADGEPAPRLNDISLSPDMALDYHEFLIDQIVRMLCLGLIHGDLSEFNVLVDEHGPVIIDLPQVVNAAGNNNAAMMLARDVNNMAEYFGRFEPGILTLKYAKEIWALFEKGKLTPHVELTGQFQESTKSIDVDGVLTVIGDARKEHEFKQLRKTREGQDSQLPPKRWNPRDENSLASQPKPNRGYAGGPGGSGKPAGERGRPPDRTSNRTSDRPNDRQNDRPNDRPQESRPGHPGGGNSRGPSQAGRPQGQPQRDSRGNTSGPTRPASPPPVRNPQPKPVGNDSHSNTPTHAPAQNPDKAWGRRPQRGDGGRRQI